MEMLIGFARSSDAFSEMLVYMENRYAGCRMDFVINPNNDAICKVLNEKNAEFDAEQQKMALTYYAQPAALEHIELYSPKWERQYCAMHRKDTYWTAEKVLAAGDRFRVLAAVNDSELIGYLDITCCFHENEPDDMYVKPEFAHQGYELALLHKAIELNKPSGMIVFVDVTASEDIKVYKAAGFEKVQGQNSVFATYKGAIQL